MSSRIRSRGYQNLTTKVIAMVAIFSIIVAVSVMVVYRANESINAVDYQYLWFKVERNEPSLDIVGDVYIFDEVGEVIEHLLLLNLSSWQCSELTYGLRSYIRIYVSFWYIDDKLDNVVYLIGSSPHIIPLSNVTVSIVSDWEEPLF